MGLTFRWVLIDLGNVRRVRCLENRRRIEEFGQKVRELSKNQVPVIKLSIYNIFLPIILTKM